jgi:Cyclophilin type peptidyl-prolyl cis-trans isomerase/CLD
MHCERLQHIELQHSGRHVQRFSCVDTVVVVNDTAVTANKQVTTDEQYDSIPRLLGRATVDLTIRRSAPVAETSSSSSSTTPVSSSSAAASTSPAAAVAAAAAASAAVATNDTKSTSSSSSSSSSSAVPTSSLVGNISLIVDGFSAPVTAGNFIDLCLRGFYNGLPINFNTTEDLSTNTILELGVGGTYKEGFVNPLTG